MFAQSLQVEKGMSSYYGRNNKDAAAERVYQNPRGK